MAAPAAGITSCWDGVKLAVTFCCARATYFADLEDDIRTLKFKITQLRVPQEDLERKVRGQMKPHMERHKNVTLWLNEVNKLRQDATIILGEAEKEVEDQNLRFFCPKKCCDFDGSGKRVKEKLEKVDELIKGGDFDQVVQIRPRVLLVERSMGKTVGLQCRRDEVLAYMKDTSTGVIGLLGMGGVGKTTLLQEIHNSFCDARKKGNRGKIDDSSKNFLRSFGLVIWVDVSKEDGVGSIQEAIFKKLEIPEEDWKDRSKSERAPGIQKLLRNRKFALLLDDLRVQTGNNDRWELSTVGVPDDYNGNESKVVFTTRHESTCRVMRATIIRVGCLQQEDALELFRQRVGEATLKVHPKLPRLAQCVVEACAGLPLALVFMGEAMLNTIDPEKWELVIRMLRNDLPRNSVMKDSVIPVLKESYESLDGETLRTCFLYLCVLLEVHNLPMEELTELWIVEGFLDDFNGMLHSRKEKHKKGEAIIRSLKDACLLESGESTNSITVHRITLAMILCLAREEGMTENKVVIQKEEKDFDKWEDAKRLSLWGPGIESLGQTPPCHWLTTLMVRATKLKTFPRRLFPSMPGLRVLNLSYNEDLAEVPGDIGQLKSLLYLNLSGTSIKVLPLEFQNLTHLEVLLLDKTKCLETIPREVIRGLSSLQVFSRRQQRVDCAKGGILDELEILEHIYEIRITLSSADSIQRLLNSPKLRKCIQNLGIAESEIVAVVDDPVEGTFSNLTHLSLEELPKLERISNCTLPFPCLRELYVCNCPNLRVLPFDSRSATNLEAIRGQTDWWERLEGCSTTVDSALSSLFRPITQRGV